jgi:Peptidase M15
VDVMEEDAEETESCNNPNPPVNINTDLEWSAYNGNLFEAGPGVFGAWRWGFEEIHIGGLTRGWRGVQEEFGERELEPINELVGAYSEWCYNGGSTKNAIRQEYQGGSGSGVTWAAPTWKPSCSDITDSGGSSTWTWAQWANHSPGNPFYPYAVVSNSSIYDALEDTKVRYDRGGLTIISFWRSPRGNRLVGGVEYAPNSRHLRGDAVDIKPSEQVWNQNERDTLVFAALNGDGVKFTWPEPWGTGRGQTTSHMHVDFR